MSRSSKSNSLSTKKIVIGIVILTLVVVFGLSILKESMTEDTAVPLLTPLPISEDEQGIDDWSQEDDSSGEPWDDSSAEESFESEDSQIDDNDVQENEEESWGEEVP